MHYSKFIDHLKNTRKFLRWTLDREHALRACLLPHVKTAILSVTPETPEKAENTLYKMYSSLLSSDFASFQLKGAEGAEGAGDVWFTPVTAVCFSLTGVFYRSLEATYAASELDLDLATARSLECASDDVSKSSEGTLLLDVLKPVKI